MAKPAVSKSSITTTSKPRKAAGLLPIPTPGEILAEEFLKPFGLSQNALARASEEAGDRQGIVDDNGARGGGIVLSYAYLLGEIGQWQFGELGPVVRANARITR